MDFFTDLWNYIKVNIFGFKPEVKPAKSSTAKKPLFNGINNTERKNEIKIVNDITDEQIQANEVRSKYISVVKNPDYKVKRGDNISAIAKKYKVEERSLLALNGLDKASARKIQPGQILKIPPSRRVKNVRTLNDVAKSMGVSLDFVKRLKHIEDNWNLPANKFHNTPYNDDTGVPTIGIGHVLKPGDPKQLTDAQVCELCANDLLRMEENLCVLLGGKQKYDKLPQGLKEALLDMTFNKGTEIIEKTPGLLYCLKTGKYEAAINKFTNNRSAITGEAMAGLSKRRLFDISLAVKMYKGKIPQSNLNTAQQVYNDGIKLLREECKEEGKNFQDQLVGFNKDVQSYFGNKIKFITK